MSALPDWTKDATGPAVIDKPEAKEKDQVKRPPLFKVVLHDDEYTPMEFVVNLLTDVFNKNRELATTIMLEVHNKGRSVAGTYTADIARTKVDTAMARARSEQHPLQITLEPE